MSEDRPPLEDQEEAEPKKAEPDRNADLLGRKDSPIREVLSKVWHAVKRGFEDQSERADAQGEYWEAYNCVLNDNQYYSGNAQIFVPAIRDAVNAVVTRLSNQLFPEGGHYVNVIADEPEKPKAIIALLDKDIGDADLKNQVCKVIIRHGLIEGQFNLGVDWMEIDRQIVSRETHGPKVTIGPEEIETPGEDIDDIKIEDYREARPAFEVLHDSDVLIWPTTADTVDQALLAGGGVAIVRRWSKEKAEALIEQGDLNGTEGRTLIAEMGAETSRRSGTPPDAEKMLAEMVGIHKQGREVTVWEVWHMLPLSEEGKYSKSGTRRIVRTFFSYNQAALGCKRNPHWNDRVPLLSVPVEKIGGVAKGKSQIEPIISLQYEANDAANEGADAAHMSANPVVLRDPAAGKQPLIMNIGAVWDMPPNAVRMLDFPDLTPRAISRIQYCIAQIFQSLSVNPSMLPQQTSTTRRNQAQVAQEQQIDLLTTTEGGSVLVAGIFTPALSWMVDLDYQYRDRPLTAQLYGTMGVRANMEEIPPQQTRTRYKFSWVGVERARNAQTNQQKIAFMNVARGLSQEVQQQGKQIDFVPALEETAHDLWGPHVGPQIIRDLRDNMSMDPKLENELMSGGFTVPIHVLDNDEQHIPAHQQDIQQNGDPQQNKALHVQLHLMQRAMKQKAQMQAQVMQQMQQMMQGKGGAPGGPPRPSRGGAPPRMGAMPAGPQLVKGPPGAVHPDVMPRAGTVPMPRKM